MLIVIFGWAMGFLQHFPESGKGGVGDLCFVDSILIGPALPLGLEGAGVLVVVTVDAEQLPVAPVGGVVFIIVILVMDGQFLQFLAGKLPPAFGADPRKDLQGLVPVFKVF